MKKELTNHVRQSYKHPLYDRDHSLAFVVKKRLEEKTPLFSINDKTELFKDLDVEWTEEVR
jgi:hypothetical protein